MQLQVNTIPAKAEQVSYFGRVGGIEATEGQTLKIETSPDGTEILNALVPEGKRGVVSVKVSVQECDV